jgi:hypothetical protein
VRSGNLTDLIGGVPEIRITVDRVDPGLLELLGAHGSITRIQECTVTLAVADLEVAPKLADALVHGGYRLYGLVPSHQSLEDLFLSLVQSTSDR